VRYRVLIVDDDPLNLQALGRVLGDTYDLVKARSAEEAMEILCAQGQDIDLILTDKSMPGRSGVDLLEEAKRLTPAMRIVITAYPDASDLIAAVNRGEVYRYVTKPWLPDELKGILQTALEHYQLGRDHAALIAELKSKNAELKAMAKRVADAFLRRIEPARPEAHAVREVLGAAAHPTVRRAARSIIQALTSARSRLRETPHGDHESYFDDVAARCLVEARLILSLVDDIDEIAS
jgi:response regulator RpfG family c-di-GMP phosphodiesterase